MNYILQPIFKKTQCRDDEEGKSHFWSITGDFIYRHYVEPRVKLYVPKEEILLTPTKYIDVTRTSHTSLDVLLKTQNDDYWNVDVETELSDAWTGFTRFVLLSERPLEGYTWSGERLTRKQTTSRPDNVWLDMWQHMSDAAKKQSKTENELSRNQSPTMPDSHMLSSSWNLTMKSSDTSFKMHVES